MDVRTTRWRPLTQRRGTGAIGSVLVGAVVAAGLVAGSAPTSAAAATQVTPQRFRALAAATSSADGPALTSLTLSQKAVEVTWGFRDVVVTAHLTDPDGVNGRETSSTTPPLVHLESQDREDVVELALLPGDDPKDGRWVGAIRFAHCCEFGAKPWIVTGLIADDTAGHRSILVTSFADPKPPLGQTVTVVDKMLTDLFLMSDSDATYGRNVVVGGTLSNQDMGEMQSGSPVRLFRRPRNGSSWTFWKTVWTDADGGFSAVDRPLANTDYLARYPGTADTASALSEPSSTLVHVIVRAVATGGAKLTVDGNVVPNKAGQAVRLQRLNKGVWSTVSLALIRSSGRYTLTTSAPPGASSYRVYKTGDASNANGVSPVMRVTVPAPAAAV